MAVKYANVSLHEISVVRLPRLYRRGICRHRLTDGRECRSRRTHLGTANGLGMTQGCELCIRRWKKALENKAVKHGR